MRFVDRQVLLDMGIEELNGKEQGCLAVDVSGRCEIGLATAVQKGLR